MRMRFHVVGTIAATGATIEDTLEVGVKVEEGSPEPPRAEIAKSLVSKLAQQGMFSVLGEKVTYYPVSALSSISAEPSLIETLTPETMKAPGLVIG